MKRPRGDAAGLVMRSQCHRGAAGPRHHSEREDLFFSANCGSGGLPGVGFWPGSAAGAAGEGRPVASLAAAFAFRWVLLNFLLECFRI